MDNLQINKELYLKNSNKVTEQFLKAELDFICDKLKKNIEKFGEKFPSACCENGQYRIKENDDWTNGFWSGMLWIAYEYTKDETFKNLAQKNTQSFIERLDNHFVLDHHDIGFLYSLSVVADYKINKDKNLEKQIVRAADKLADRFHQDAGFIQAWGQMDNEQEYRLIIDSLLNLPLLYVAYNITQNESYKNIADRHYKNVVENIIRQDYSTYHTYYFDKDTKKPFHGATHQGFNDNSCWARGQAWAILGIPLHFQNEWRSIDKNTKEIYKRVADYFIKNTPEDGVPFWDMLFIKEDNQSRDTSALIITALGLLLADKYNLYDDEDGEQIARGMLAILSDGYTSKNKENEEGILLEGVYAYMHGKGINQANLWGDYFYMEVLYRLLNTKWKGYW